MRFVFLMLAAVFCLSITGCAGTASDAAAADEAATPAADEAAPAAEEAAPATAKAPCASKEAAAGDSASACACSKGKAGESVWCDGCGKGYHEGKAVKCKGCYASKVSGADCAGCGSGQ